VAEIRKPDTGPCRPRIKSIGRVTVGSVAPTRKSRYHSTRARAVAFFEPTIGPRTSTTGSRRRFIVGRRIVRIYFETSARSTVVSHGRYCRLSSGTFDQCTPRVRGPAASAVGGRYNIRSRLYIVRRVSRDTTMAETFGRYIRRTDRLPARGGVFLTSTVTRTHSFTYKKYSRDGPNTAHRRPPSVVFWSNRFSNRKTI